VTISSNAIETLRNAEVKKYFIKILKSGSSPDDKYETLVRFFELERDLTLRLLIADDPLEDEAAVSRAVASAASGIWQPDLILEQTEDGLKRALGRVSRSQHSDGGWGFEFEKSHLWATAWTVLLLHRAAQLGLEADRQAEEKGQEWLIENRCRWSLDPEDIRAGGNSVYEASLAMRTLFATGAATLPSVRRSTERSLSRLLKEQKSEGDWAATLFGSSSAAAPEDLRDVGATSFALQALGATGRLETELERAADRALKWLAAQQNPDGSWNASYVPPDTPGPLASVGKTCDALRGFLAGQRLGVDLAPYRQILDQGVQWLVGREEAKLNAEGRIVGWVWKSEPETLQGQLDLNFLENTCLTLETLLDLETVPLPQLAANALWLLHKQLPEEGSPDDGKWPNNDTGRIAYAVLKFYWRIKGSPLFEVAPAATAPSAQAEIA
jgi:hypothetical protein